MHNPYEVTVKLIVLGVGEEGEEHPTGGRGGQIQVTRGDTYSEDIEVGDDLSGGTGVLSFWASNRMFTLKFAPYMHMEHTTKGGTHPQHILYKKLAQKAKYLSLDFIDDVTLRHFFLGGWGDGE